MNNESILVAGWESYERNGEGCIFFKSEEAAHNHNFFEVESVVKSEIYLSPEGVEEFHSGIPIWH